ncbi:unnamed protein product [Effrenium voratum]|uniref:Uncharacterized protein n=2 Tax=Effrenium voratum TaxID=2562239 RepID=A0AA36IS62_9DINO|nr:unnamed protein product [Effrenium voratum]
MSSPSIFPSFGQIVRRCGGLLRAIDLVHSFRCYTSLVLLVDMLRHGVHYLALPTMLEALWHPQRHSHAHTGESMESAAAATVAAVGFLLTALSQVLLSRVTGGRRLTLSMMLWGAWGEVLCPALIFALVCLADLAAVVAPLDYAMSPGRDASASHLTPEDSGFVAASERHDLSAQGHAWRSNGRSPSAVVISLQALLRASLLVTIRLAQRQRSSRVLP